MDLDVESGEGGVFFNQSMLGGNDGGLGANASGQGRGERTEEQTLTSFSSFALSFYDFFTLLSTSSMLSSHITISLATCPTRIRQAFGITNANQNTYLVQERQSASPSDSPSQQHTLPEALFSLSR
jgi:hypothetical protein